MDCVFCGSENPLSVIKRKLPLMVRARNSHVDNPIYALKIGIYMECGLGYNLTPVKESDLRKIYNNYSYLDTFNNIGTTKFKQIFNIIKKHINKNSSVVEIGCSEGYLVNLLKDQGYQNISGIEPSPQAAVALKNGINIRKEYYTSDSYSTNQVDAFILCHVFEHFSNPFEIFENMIGQLSEYGKIIIETPNFDGFHHEHLFYYSPLFYKNLAAKYNLKIIDLIDANPVIVVFSKMTDNKDNVLVTSTIHNLVKEIEAKEKIFKNIINELKEFLNLHEKIYWWGTGSYAVILISQLQDSLELLKKIIPIDSQTNRVGLHLPGIQIPIQHASVLFNTSINSLVISSSFFKEIQQILTENNIEVKDLFIPF